jgi:phage gp36-like protein
MTVRVKQPAETLVYEFDFASFLSAVSGTPTVAIDPEGALTAGALEALGSKARVQLTGGVAGTTYLICCRASSTDGLLAELEGEIRCVDLGFVVPEGQTSPYLTAQEYVDRFGLAETVETTDELGTGVVDAQRLGAALMDATADVEAYLAGRYAVPLSPVPATIKDKVAALARRRLWRNGAPQAVVDAAQDTIVFLTSAAKGVILLPNAAGALPTTSAADVGAPQASSPARLFTRTTLTGY